MIAILLISMQLAFIPTNHVSLHPQHNVCNMLHSRLICIHLFLACNYCHLQLIVCVCVCVCVHSDCWDALITSSIYLLQYNFCLIFIVFYFADRCNIGIHHPSVHHLHLYLNICLQSRQLNQLYCSKCGTKPGKWFRDDVIIPITWVAVSYLSWSQLREWCNSTEQATTKVKAIRMKRKYKTMFHGELPWVHIILYGSKNYKSIRTCFIVFLYII